MHLVEKWKHALNQSKSCGILLMDLSKAFDCIPHYLLIAKLQAYGIDENALTFMSSYLRNRKQRVKIQGHNSEWLNLSKGIPKGSISIPTVFNFFVNDFCLLFIEELLTNYADDNSICVIREQLFDVKYALGAETEKAIRWFEENHMRANPVKFQCIVHTKTPTLNFSISLGETDITPSDIVDLLGMIIDDKLSFGQHVKNIIHKASLK